MKKTKPSFGKTKKTVATGKPRKVRKSRSASKQVPVTLSRIQKAKFSPPATALKTKETQETASGQVLRELRNLRSWLAKRESAATSMDEALEGSVDSLRRLLSEVIEKRTEWILSKIVAVRTELSDSPGAAGELDRLLEELGAVRFEAGPKEHVDPLIHAVVKERRLPHEPEGIIVETVRPGYRTGAGKVLAKALVAVSRRS